MGKLSVQLLVWLALFGHHSSDPSARHHSARKHSARNLCSQAALTSINVGDEVCRIVYALLSSYPSQTFVFVLHMEQKSRDSVDYLRTFSNVHLYLSDDIFVMKPNDREVVISWERDRNQNPWDYMSTCGHRGCDDTNQNLINLRLDKRVLIQVREVPFRQPRETIEGDIIASLSLKTYVKYYRSTFILFRLAGTGILHSSLQVHRTGQVVGNTVLKLTVTATRIPHIKQTLDPAQKRINRTKFTVGFFGIFFPDGAYIDRFTISSCLQVRVMVVSVSAGRVLRTPQAQTKYRHTVLLSIISHVY